MEALDYLTIRDWMSARKYALSNPCFGQFRRLESHVNEAKRHMEFPREVHQGQIFLRAQNGFDADNLTSQQVLPDLILQRCIGLLEEVPVNIHRHSQRIGVTGLSQELALSADPDWEWVRLPTILPAR